MDKIKFAATVGPTGWAIAVAGAGPGGLLEKFWSDVRAALPMNAPYKQRQFENIVEVVLSHYHKKYPNDPIRIILGLSANHGMERLLYRSEDDYLTPVLDHAHVGVGHSLWRFLSDVLYRKLMSVEDVERLAIFIMKQAIKYVDGVDGPIQVAAYTFGEPLWRGPAAKEIRTIEGEFKHDDLVEVLRKYWRIHNPPTREEQLNKYGGVRTPGDELTLLEGVKLEELYTVAGRRRASKIFRRNTDKLQQRGLLERQRRQGPASGASQPSVGKNRT
ncbi:MAG TPA: hypothetical protein VFQ41_05875 [Candidatus Angelobacter sp.]|nr:hypothetical protein [Candidatus Angelobacter sp.]